MDTPTDRIHVAGGRHSSSQLSRLCHACQSILTRDDLEEEDAYLHHSSLESFIEANRMKCYVCSHAFRSLGSIPEDIQEILCLATEEGTPDIVVEEETQSTDNSTSDRRAALIRRIFKYPERGLPGVSLTYMRLVDDRGMWLRMLIRLNPHYEELFPVNTEVYDSSLRGMWNELRISLLNAELMVIPDQGILMSRSMQTWSTVGSWIKECSEHHPCMAQVDTNWFPTRLIERTSNGTFRVIRSDSISRPTGGYITLSHRWGSTDFIRLTTDNLSDLERGLSVTILPKTFREALVVAQRLNIRYIWIDSLCIIQSGDNGEDWQQEAAEMANVYSNSFCNISADYGDNQTDGLFFDRTPSFEPACIMHLRCKIDEIPENDPQWDKTSPELLELTGGCLCHIMRPDGWCEDVLESPLNLRGWVLQERLLAPRVLHFTPGQVSWECGQKLAWEKAANSKLLAYMDSYHEIRWKMERFSFDGPLPSDPVFWKENVERYSSCGMSKQSDRLVAISGVAKRMVSFAGDQYVAGLWASCMPFSLGWEINASFRGHRRAPDERPSRLPSTGYYTPSFSWAATSGRVVGSWNGKQEEAGLVTAFIKHRKRPLYSAVTKTGRPKIDAQVLTSHVFGPLTSPVVEVQARGILRTCHRIPQRLLPEDRRDDRDEHYFAPSRSVNDSATHLCFERGITMKVSYDRPGEPGDAETNDSTYYFTIYRWLYSERSGYREENPNPQPSEYRVALGLLLKSVDPVMGRFKRVGHVTVRRPIDKDPSVSDVGARLGNEHGLPAWSYNETTGEHVFYIV